MIHVIYCSIFVGALYFRPEGTRLARGFSFGYLFTPITRSIRQSLIATEYNYNFKELSQYYVSDVNNWLLAGSYDTRTAAFSSVILLTAWPLTHFAKAPLYFIFPHTLRVTMTAQKCCQEWERYNAIWNTLDDPENLDLIPFRDNSFHSSRLGPEWTSSPTTPTYPRGSRGRISMLKWLGHDTDLSPDSKTEIKCVCVFGFHKMRGISWLAANQLASQEGLCTM